MRADGEQRVAIWWRTHDGLSSDIAAGARPILKNVPLRRLCESEWLSLPFAGQEVKEAKNEVTH
jgi:hypothetical protein